MKNLKQTSSASSGWLAIGLIAAVLVVLFYRSFHPDYVFFSNDGPLGVQNAAWVRMPAAMSGVWVDLNYLGSSGGAYTPSITGILHVVFSPIYFAKFYPLVALFILGLGAWTLFRQLKLSPLAAALGALAAMLNSTFFSTACWGVASQEIAAGMNFFAAALIVGCNATMPAPIRWSRLMLAGLCVGMNVMEAADIGGLYSVMIALFVFWRELTKDFVPFSKVERIVILCLVNALYCVFLTAFLVLGLLAKIDAGFIKLCLVTVACGALNWSLFRQPIPLSTIEKITAFVSINLGLVVAILFGFFHAFGLIFYVSVLAAAFFLNWALLYYPLFVNRCGTGVVHLMVISVFAGFIALQAMQALLGVVGATTRGVTSAATDSQSKADNTADYDWATQWSLPKMETVGLIVPGLFGYKMNTPEYMSWFPDAYQNGVYWGGMGRDPAIDRYFDAGSQGQQPQGYMRFTGGGNYCGILVMLVVGWAIAQSLRKQNPIFPDTQKRMVQFWAVVMLLCLLLAWGRFAPFYAWFYQLPYAASIRNPAKFLNFFSWALAIVFAYGVHALHLRYLDSTATNAAGIGDQVKNWWAKASSFDRKWAYTSLGLFGASVLGWLIYNSQKTALIDYLAKVGFGGSDATADNSGAAIADFSIGQAGWFVVLFAIGVVLMLLVIAGYFNGSRVKIGIMLLGGFLILDMGRANLPWLVDWDYKQKYEVGSLDPIVDFLRTKPYEHRVAGLPFEPQRQLRLYDYLFGGNGLYRIEWMQHHFPYYNVQSLDIVQMPRMPADMKAYKEALMPHDPATYPLLAREWMLTNTRYLLGAADFLPVLNQELDPGQQRFRIVQRFDIVPKPGITHPARLEEMTAVTSNDGDLALFEFTGALPRAKIYSNWLVNTNDDVNLKMLGNLNFDPAKTVLISTPEQGLAASANNENSGSVDYQSYDTKHIVLSANTTGPAVLLLNDKFDPGWDVTVDGKPANILRCNFMMRGVYLPTAGQHTVDFQFHVTMRALYITLSGIVFAIILCGFLAFAGRNRQTMPA